MSFTEYSKELEAFIAKQKRLLELDKERISSAPVKEPSKQVSTPAEELREVDSGNVITTQRIPSNPSKAKLSKEKVNSQISRKTNVVQEEDTGVRVNTSREQTEAASGSIDLINIDPRQDVVDNLSSASTEEPSPVVSANHAKQMSPQQDEMEQWVSDTFFSYFPSFNKKQKEQKTVLSRTRQQEYQEYLKNIPEVTTKHQQYMQKYGTGKPSGTETTNEKGTSPPPPPSAAAGQPQVRFGKSLVAEANANFRKGSPREKLIQDLAHTDLPTILNTDTIDRRNRMLADEESRRKMEYQKELIKQIEEKRKEVERLREKEKLEEEMLTSRLEQQLKTMQLEEQLEHERVRSEKIRIANEQNHIRRLQLLANLENDHKLFNPYDGQRKAFSENGVKVVAPAAATSSIPPGASQHPNGSYSSGDERTKVYRYFSNSAQQQQQQQQEKHNHFVSFGAASSSALSSEQDYESSSETTNNSLIADHRYQYCKSCRADIDRSFLPPQPSVGTRGGEHSKQKRQHCAKCGCKRSTGQMNTDKKQEDPSVRCMKCDRSMKRSHDAGRGLAALCAVCTLTTDADRKNMLHQKFHQEKRLHGHNKARHRTTLLDDDDDDEAVQVHQAPAVSPKNNPYKILDIQYHESDNDNGDLDVLNPVIVRNNYRKPPYSLNIEKDSLFHPSKKTPEPVLSVNIRNGEVFVDNKIRTGGGIGGPTRVPASPSDADDGHRDDETSTATVGDDMLDERIAKYVRHYNTLWMKRGNRKSNVHHNYQQHHHHSHHLHHLLREHDDQDPRDGMKGGGGGKSSSGTLLPSLSPPKVYVSDRPENLKSDGLKLVEKKWEIPAVERTKVNEKGSTRVLTQLGAIRKQLQLEQLQMDDPSSYSKKY